MKILSFIVLCVFAFEFSFSDSDILWNKLDVAKKISKKENKHIMGTSINPR